jgi:hypothetical protein
VLLSECTLALFAAITLDALRAEVAELLADR